MCASCNSEKAWSVETVCERESSLGEPNVDYLSSSRIHGNNTRFRGCSAVSLRDTLT